MRGPPFARRSAYGRYSTPIPRVGECRFSRILPSPEYMCTPQGRHGSKLRTVRMMSMPLKSSGPFSSKIGLPCDRVLVGARGAVRVGRRPVPRRRRVGVVVGDLAVPDHQVVREYPANRLVEAAADRLVGHLELLEDLGLSRAHELQRPVQEVERHRRRVGDEVDAGPVALDGVGPLRHVPHRTASRAWRRSWGG